MDFQVGDVVNRTFGTISRNFAVFLMLSAALVGIPTLLLGLAQIGVAFGSGSYWALFIVALLVNVAAAYILQGALIHGAIMDFNGGRASFADCLSTGMRHALPLFVIAILMGLGVMLGMLLFIVPGIILSIVWLVAIPAHVVENTGITESFGRSRDLTRNNRWKIFGLLIIYAIIATFISMLVAVPAGVFSSPGDLSNPMAPSIGVVIFNVIATVATALVGATGVAAIYYELRKTKEGIGAEALAKVFE